MKLVKMIRDVPEVPNAPTTTEVQEQDIPALESRGWKVVGEPYEMGIPSGDDKAVLLARALELDLGDPAELESMTADELTALIADNTDDTRGDDKSALVAKALSLKESNPKAVHASPSAIPSMSVNKLTALIAEAEAIIKEQV